MAEFIIGVPERHICYYRVYADSVEEAKTAIDEGEFEDVVELEFINVLDEPWSVSNEDTGCSAMLT
jgi:hypothetical protein